MARIRFGTFLAPHHPVGEHPTLQFQRDLRLAEHLDKLGFEVVATDLVDRGFGRGGVDFFECSSFPAGCRTMVTNPPYGDGGQLGRPPAGPLGLQTFIRHALDLTERANGQLALLVRFQWIAGKRAATLISSGPLSRSAQGSYSQQ